MSESEPVSVTEIKRLIRNLSNDDRKYFINNLERIIGTTDNPGICYECGLFSLYRWPIHSNSDLYCHECVKECVCGDRYFDSDAEDHEDCHKIYKQCFCGMYRRAKCCVRTLIVRTVDTELEFVVGPSAWWDDIVTRGSEHTYVLDEKEFVPKFRAPLSECAQLASNTIHKLVVTPKMTAFAEKEYVNHVAPKKS